MHKVFFAYRHWQEIDELKAGATDNESYIQEACADLRRGTTELFQYEVKDYRCRVGGTLFWERL